jgi:hypothetical protein
MKVTKINGADEADKACQKVQLALNWMSRTVSIRRLGAAYFHLHGAACLVYWHSA